MVLYDVQMCEYTYGKHHGNSESNIVLPRSLRNIMFYPLQIIHFVSVNSPLSFLLCTLRGKPLIWNIAGGGQILRTFRHVLHVADNTFK